MDFLILKIRSKTGVKTVYSPVFIRAKINFLLENVALKTQKL